MVKAMEAKSNKCRTHSRPNVLPWFLEHQISTIRRVQTPFSAAIGHCKEKSGCLIV